MSFWVLVRFSIGLKMLITKPRFNYWTIGLFVIIGVHLCLLSRLIFFPYPELFVYSYLTQKGLLPYAQILDQHFPGLMFFPVNLASLGMATPQAARMWHLGTVFVTQILLFVVAKKLFKSEKWALLASLLYLLWQPFFEGYVLWIDTFVAPLLLASFIFLVNWIARKNKKELFWVGIFLGASLLFKQVVMPLIILIVFFVWKNIKSTKELLPLLVGTSVFPVFLLLYIVKINVWNDFIYWTLTFNLTTFSEMGRKYPDFSGIIRSTLLFGSSLFSCLYMLIKKRDEYLVILGLFLVGSLAFAYARFDFVHLQPAIPFAVLILVVFLKNIKLKSITLALYLLMAFVFLIPFYKAHFGSRVLFFGEYEYTISEKVKELTDPNDSVFAMATFSHLYQMTDTMPPGNVFVFQFPWFMIEAKDRVFSGIISDPPKVVVRDKNATTGGQNLVSYMGKIGKYVEDNYIVIEEIYGTEIMIPK